MVIRALLMIRISSVSLRVAASEYGARKPASEKSVNVEGLLSIPNTEIPLCSPVPEMQPSQAPFPKARTVIIIDGEVVN